MISSLFCFMLGVATSAASIDRPKDVTCVDGYYNTSVAQTTLWDGLSAVQRKNAGTCGLDQPTWDGPSETCWSLCWSDLSKEKQRAVTVFGSNAACYDSSMNLYGLKCTTKSVPSDCDVKSGVLKTSLPAVMKAWTKLSPAMRVAATACGQSKKSWDGPSDCRACFADLSPSKKQAVLSLGTDPKCFDQSMRDWYGIDCVKLMRDSPSPKKRSTLYAGLSMASAQQKFQIRHKISTQTPSASNFNHMHVVMLGFVACGVVFMAMGSAMVSLRDANKDSERMRNFNDDVDEELETLLRVEGESLE